MTLVKHEQSIQDRPDIYLLKEYNQANMLGHIDDLEVYERPRDCL